MSSCVEQSPQPASDHDDSPTLIGKCLVFRQLLRIADAVADNDSIVLLEGESGTGKELIARRIHFRSRRSAGPFIPVNCPAVTETLFESQFYGHVKGSFTGAAGDTLGIVRAAENGTLFLDEIGEMPLHLQPKLLRLLQHREITPVGGTRPIQVNVRFLAATNRSLARAVADGKFRNDLYHRLNVVRIYLPSLQERTEDIELLVEFYLEHYAKEYGMEIRQLVASIRKALISYPWPGNVRELCCWVERLYAAKLPATPPINEIWQDHHPDSISSDPVEMYTPNHPANAVTGSLADAEIDAIRNALTQSRNNRSIAAKLLNIHRTTLLRKMKQYNLA